MIAESNRSTDVQIGNSNAVAETVVTNLNDEIDKLKESYENQVLLNTDLKDQLTGLQEELSSAKEGLINEDVEDNKTALGTKLEDTKESLTKVGESFTEFFQNNQTATTTHLTSIKDAYSEYFNAIKVDTGKSIFMIAKYEGFLGVSIKARLDYTLYHYRDYFDEIKVLADDAYRYLAEKSVFGQYDNGNGVSRSIGNSELFHYQKTDAIASSGGKMAADKVRNANDFTKFFSAGFLNKIQQSVPEQSQVPQPINIYLQFGDGQIKEISNKIEQIKNDRRGYTA